MASHPVVPRPCSKFSRHSNPPESSSSARRRMDPESEFVPSQPVANEKSLLLAVHSVSRNSVTSLRSLGKDFETGTLDRYERRARSQRDYDARPGRIGHRKTKPSK